MPLRHVRHQGPVIRALLGTAARATLGRRPEAPSLPTAALSDRVPARKNRMVDAYLRHLGTDPARYDRVVPPHLFPQWAFPLLSKTSAQLPYDLTKVLNAGCRLTVHRPLPRNEELHLRARIESIDDNGQRAKIVQRVWTSSASAPDALEAEIHAFVPLRRSDGPKKDKPTVPLEAESIGSWTLDRRAGLDFAQLTGDFNPIHWVPLAARAAGFRGCINHGFSSFARTWETLEDSVGPVRQLHARFLSPLVLPARPRVFVDDRQVMVGEAPGAAVYLTGEFRCS